MKPYAIADVSLPASRLPMIDANERNAIEKKTSQRAADRVNICDVVSSSDRKWCDSLTESWGIFDGV